MRRFILKVTLIAVFICLLGSSCVFKHDEGSDIINNESELYYLNHPTVPDFAIAVKDYWDANAFLQYDNNEYKYILRSHEGVNYTGSEYLHEIYATALALIGFEELPAPEAGFSSPGVSSDIKYFEKRGVSVLLVYRVYRSADGDVVQSYIHITVDTY